MVQFRKYKLIFASLWLWAFAVFSFQQLSLNGEYQFNYKQEAFIHLQAHPVQSRLTTPLSERIYCPAFDLKKTGQFFSAFRNPQFLSCSIFRKIQPGFSLLTTGKSILTRFCILRI